MLRKAFKLPQLGNRILFELATVTDDFPVKHKIHLSELVFFLINVSVMFK